MNHIDLINAFFEGGGSILCWMNVLKIRRDRTVKGVFWPTQVFWSLWGLWNLYYYSAVGHPFSFWCGAVLVSGNIAWTLHAAWYAHRSRQPCTHSNIAVWPCGPVCQGCGKVLSS